MIEGNIAPDRRPKVPELDDWAYRTSLPFLDGDLFYHDGRLYQWHGSVDDALPVRSRTGVFPAPFKSPPELFLDASIDPARAPSGADETCATNLTEGSARTVDQLSATDRPSVGARTWFFDGAEWWAANYGSFDPSTFTLVFCGRMDVLSNTLRLIGSSNAGSNPFIGLRWNGSGTFSADVRDSNGDNSFAFATPTTANTTDQFIFALSFSKSNPRATHCVFRGFGDSISSTDTGPLSGNMGMDTTEIGRFRQTQPHEGDMCATAIDRTFYNSNELVEIVEFFADLKGISY